MARLLQGAQRCTVDSDAPPKGAPEMTRNGVPNLEHSATVPCGFSD